MAYIPRTLEGLVNRFKSASDGVSDDRYCFVLGAGASLESGIRTGQQLVDEWDAELVGSLPPGHYEKWRGKLGITRDNRQSFYSEYYYKNFEDNPRAGRKRLEELMKDARPSCGYVILSHILTKTRHNIVITTNFDHLTEDAVSYYELKMPMVLGHEALARHYEDNLTLPVVLKLHRDLLLGPVSAPEDIKVLPAEWGKTLDRVFRAYHPVFIGYAGNDPSLMDFLESRAEMFGNIYRVPYWLLFKESEPKGRVRDFLDKADGVCISHNGFDGTMVQIGAALGYRAPSENEFMAEPLKRHADLLKALHDCAEEQERRDRERIDAQKPAEDSASEALGSIIGDGEPETPVSLLRDIWSQPYKKQVEMLGRAAERFPDDPWLIGTRARVEHLHGDAEKAEEYFKQAIQIDGNNARNLGHYAIFLENTLSDYDDAEAFYIRAVEVDPEHASNLGNYANFLTTKCKDYDSAEEYYERSIEANPNHSTLLSNYAYFLEAIRNNYDPAKEYYERAVGADSGDANVLGKYAIFLDNKLKDYDSAREMYARAIEADPGGMRAPFYARRLEEISGE